MAVGIHTVNLANKWLDALSNTSFVSGTATLYAQLHTGDPGSAGTTFPCEHTVRQTISWSAASGGTKSASGSPVCAWTIANVTGNVTVSHLSIWSSLTGGTFFFSVDCTDKSISNTDTLNLTSLAIGLAPLAA
jgi:hypothetical protein